MCNPAKSAIHAIPLSTDLFVKAHFTCLSLPVSVITCHYRLAICGATMSHEDLQDSVCMVEVGGRDPHAPLFPSAQKHELSPTSLMEQTG